jgi:hypothetical protein
MSSKHWWRRRHTILVSSIKLTHDSRTLLLQPWLNVGHEGPECQCMSESSRSWEDLIGVTGRECAESDVKDLHGMSLYTSANETAGIQP